MIGDWEQALAAKSMPRRDIGALGDMIAEGNGESRFICRLADHPRWLYKEYQSPLPIPSATRLATLIELPRMMTVDDTTLIDRQTSWPASRVTGDAGETVGAIMPEAPEKFTATLIIPATGSRKIGPLIIDLLASGEEKQATLGLPRQSLDERLAVARSLLAVADLYERYGLVYLDWSYANAFWSTVDHSVYVIDMDGASIGPRRQIQSPNWDDPLVPFGTHAGNESDRYRVALLVARCLTGLRPANGDLDAALAALGRGKSPEFGALTRTLREALSARDVTRRPSLGDLKAALDDARIQDTPRGTPTSGPVIDWVPISTIKRTGRPPAGASAVSSNPPSGQAAGASRPAVSKINQGSGAGAALKGLAVFVAVMILIIVLLALHLY